jgi:hypothetical protein
MAEESRREDAPSREAWLLARKYLANYVNCDRLAREIDAFARSAVENNARCRKERA